MKKLGIDPRQYATVARVCRGECDPKYLTTLSYGVNSFLKAINLSDVQQRLEKVEQAIRRNGA